jgi:DNA-binding response OmpR family regulator
MTIDDAKDYLREHWPSIRSQLPGYAPMVTAYGDDQRRRRASELGACEFLTKPVDFDLLKARLARLPRIA